MILVPHWACAPRLILRGAVDRGAFLGWLLRHLLGIRCGWPEVLLKPEYPVERLLLNSLGARPPFGTVPPADLLRRR